jgi:large subunit ribosomal protein L15
MPLYRRIPKRGFSNARFEKTSVHVNVSELNRFEDGAKVTPLDLKAAGILKGTFDAVRLLGKGDIERRLEVHVHHASAGARSKVEAAGGTCVIIPPTGRRPKGVKKEA